MVVGGKMLMWVFDDGMGMCCEDLMLVVCCYCMFKMFDDNLFDICLFGFCGEVLFLIGLVVCFGI